MKHKSVWAVCPGSNKANRSRPMGKSVFLRNPDSAGGTVASTCTSYLNLVRHKNPAQMRWSFREKISTGSPFLIRYSIGLFLVQNLSDSKSKRQELLGNICSLSLFSGFRLCRGLPVLMINATEQHLVLVALIFFPFLFGFLVCLFWFLFVCLEFFKVLSRQGMIWSFRLLPEFFCFFPL